MFVAVLKILKSALCFCGFAQRAKRAGDTCIVRQGTAKYSLYGVLVFYFGFLHFAFAEFKVPELTGPVVDNAHVLNSSGGKIEALLRKVREAGGSQITVLTVEDLGDEPIEQASIKVVDAWKLGDEKTDRGLLILLAKKERKVRIEVGQGLEGEVPDVIAKRIVSDVMVPYFKEGNFEEGLYAGILRVLSYSDPELKLEKNRDRRSTKSSMKFGVLFWFVIAYFIISALGFSGGRRRVGGSGFFGGGLGGWGGGGGFGGGGSWGGGGGGFSGGGASGDW